MVQPEIIWLPDDDEQVSTEEMIESIDDCDKQDGGDCLEDLDKQDGTDGGGES